MKDSTTSNVHPNYGGTEDIVVDEVDVHDVAGTHLNKQCSCDVETQRRSGSDQPGSKRSRQPPSNNPMQMQQLQLATSSSSRAEIIQSTDDNDEEHRHSASSIPYTIKLDANGSNNIINIDDDDIINDTSPYNTPIHHHRNQRPRRSSWGDDLTDITTLAESVFSHIRSDSTATRLSISNEAAKYRHCTGYQRAFPERSIALVVTLIFELPTLMLISGGSDQLCALIGRKKYTTLISLLPLISAISGNVGLQASTLTTRAISHEQVRVNNYTVWLWKEIMAAFYLGMAIGTITAIISFCMGGYNFPFAISIFTAQFIGILTAGCTGTLAPLLFTFIFQRDSGKWGGPLETAVQDIVGSFAMIVVTYRIMLFFGPFALEDGDMC